MALLMVWLVKKKIFYHILNMGYERVRIPIRAKFEFEIKNGRFVPDSLSFESLYNHRALAKRYPALNKALLEKEIQNTVQHNIRDYLIGGGYIIENMKHND